MKLKRLWRDSNPRPVAQKLKAQNPIFSNPAVAPIIEATTSQLQTKYPDASPAELTQMAQDYVLAMSQAFNPETPPETPAGETDWSDWENKF